jgi:hypothetical protein
MTISGNARKNAGRWLARLGALLCILASGVPASAQHVQLARLQGGPYIIDYPADRPRLGRSIAQIIEQAPPLPALPRDAPAFGQTIHITMAASDAHFDAVTGGAVPEWGAGVANPAAGWIVIPGYAGGRAATSNMRRVLRHELAHIALHRYLAPARVPRWFNEGYSVWAAGELDLEAEWQLRVAFATRRAPPLDSLELAWPTATEDARIAYLLSASIVNYLVRASGVPALELFMQRWRATQDMDQALAVTYGMSVDQLEKYWIRDVRKRYGWLAVVTQSAVFMAGASVLLLVLFAIRRRRDRRKLAVLQATELPDAPAYWNEDDSVVDDTEPKDEV